MGRKLDNWVKNRLRRYGGITAEHCDSAFAALNYFLLPALIMRLNVATFNAEESVDRLVPGMSKKIEQILQMSGANPSVVPDRVAPEQLAASPPFANSKAELRDGANGPPLSLPFSGQCGQWASKIPIYHINAYVRAVEAELARLCETAQRELEGSVQEVLAVKQAADGLTVGGVEALGDTTPTPRSPRGFADEFFPSEEEIFSPDNTPPESPVLEVDEEVDDPINRELERAAQRNSSSRVGPHFPTIEGDSMISELEEETPKKLSKRQRKIEEQSNNPVHAFARWCLTPVRLAFQSVFCWRTRDAALYVTILLYFWLMIVGLKYFSYTPVCLLFGLLGPKTKGGKFMRKRFMGEPLELPIEKQR